MARAVAGAVLAAAVALAGCAEPPPPEFLSKADRFRVQFGGARPEVAERPVGGARAVTYKVEGPAGSRSVTVTDLPVKGDEPPEFVPWLLDSAKGDLIRAAGGTEEASRSHVLAGKYPGREFSARITQPAAGRLRGRVWVVGGRLYQVLVIGTADFADADAATAFLDSFQLTE